MLEILSASCYSESSTSLVLHGIRLLSRRHAASSASVSSAFAGLNTSLLAMDIEVKVAILQFIVSIILGGDMNTYAELRGDLRQVGFDATCAKALQQVSQYASSRRYLL